MLRRRHINGDTPGRGARFLAAIVDVARWPFERLAWAVERRALWPLQRRLARRPTPRRGAGIAALSAIAAGAVAAVVLLAPGDGAAPRQQASAPPTQVAVVAADSQPRVERSQAPSLQGVPPSFGVDKGVGVAESGGAGATEAEAPTSSSAQTESSQGQPSDGESAASASSAAEPVPAGPAAMKVARRFSEAFVFYEIGKKQARAKAVFGETATEQLATALDERPPRLPSEAQVPKAKVLNLVPGPRFGRQYTVSVSLLRVGVTSELRLTLQKEKDGAWSVAQVLG